MSQDSQLKERALSYLVAGCSQEQTARALGCEPSVISYFMSADDSFAQQVADAELLRRHKYNKIDDRWDSIEAKALEKLEEMSEYITQPGALLKLATQANAAKRRGSTAPVGTNITNQQIVQLQLPAVMLQAMKMNQQSQIVQAGQQELVTIQSGSLKALAEKFRETESEAPNVSNATVKQIPHASPAVTLNGVTPARQTVSQFGSRALKAEDTSAEALGF